MPRQKKLFSPKLSATVRSTFISIYIQGPYINKTACIYLDNLMIMFVFLLFSLIYAIFFIRRDNQRRDQMAILIIYLNETDYIGLPVREIQIFKYIITLFHVLYIIKTRIFDVATVYNHFRLCRCHFHRRLGPHVLLLVY